MEKTRIMTHTSVRKIENGYLLDVDYETKDSNGSINYEDERTYYATIDELIVALKELYVKNS